MYSNNFCYDDNSQLSQYYSPIFIWMCYGWCNKFSRVKSPKSETRCTLLWIPCLSWQHWIPLSAMVLLLLFKFKLKSRFGLRLHECQFLAKVAPVTDFLFMLFRFYWAEIWCQTWSTSKLTVNHLQIALEVFWWVVWLKQQRDVIFIVLMKEKLCYIYHFYARSQFLCLEAKNTNRLYTDRPNIGRTGIPVIQHHMKEVAVRQQRNSCGDECDPGIHVLRYFCGILRHAGPFWIIYHKMFGEQSYCKMVSYVNSNTESLLVIAGKLIWLYIL